MLLSVGCGGVLSAADVPGQVAAETAALPRAAMPMGIDTLPEIQSGTTGQPGSTTRAARVTQGATPRGPGEAPVLPPRKPGRLAAEGTPATRRSPTWIAGRVGIVLAVFLGLILIQRVLGPRPRPTLTAGAIQVCGRVPLDSKQSLHLVRLGQRLLVLLESPQGMQPIAEITDPQEVRRLLEPSRGDGPTSESLNVGQVLAQFRHRESTVA